MCAKYYVALALDDVRVVDIPLPSYLTSRPTASKMLSRLIHSFLFIHILLIFSFAPLRFTYTLILRPLAVIRYPVVSKEEVEFARFSSIRCLVSFSVHNDNGFYGSICTHYSRIIYGK